MGTHKNLERELERVLNTQSATLQHESFSALLQSISVFVAQVKEEESLVNQIDKQHKERKKVEKLIQKMSRDENAPEEKITELTTELEEINMLLEKAMPLRRTIAAKKATLSSLKGEVKALMSAIKK